jgi:hypothetical protein
VTALGPQFCGSNSTQAFCSIFDANLATCVSQLGSPLINGDVSSSSIDGFVISEGSCSRNGSRFVLHYHSVDDFRDWIEQVSGADSVKKVSGFLVLSAILIRFWWFVISWEKQKRILWTMAILSMIYQEKHWWKINNRDKSDKICDQIFNLSLTLVRKGSSGVNQK